MARPEKEKLVDELKQRLTDSEVSILTEYTGLNVQAMTDLRNQLRKAAVDYRVFKNTLARIAAQQTGLEEVLQFIQGATGYAFSNDPVATAKVLADFSKANPNMKIKCAVLKGKVVAGERVQAIASLPPREVLLAQVLGQMKAPMTGLVNVLSGPIRNLIYAIEDLRKKKEAA
ncbi:MAG: 50S ribosomal protein L10 [Candidatus Abyssobacteria bacterium SURF_5]|uniref:Large ribosomal subunit protein uL10 n=1 Tax=Abyssobacteria bacterium (strain SURF_5) TaxID=2093360 RepID=A0A3A4NKU2_ABYX5|nr:MAG: 50S ribosomal protein L10 [Candidatus Abyssubacteria bacterium SURF_5]